MINFFVESSSLAALITKLKMKGRDRIVQKVLLVAEPVTTSNSYGSVIGCLHDGQYYVCIHGGYHFPVQTIAELLVYITQLFFVFNIEYPTQANKFYNFLACVLGAADGMKLPPTQRALIQ